MNLTCHSSCRVSLPQNMKADFAKELEKFDREQVLSAWDDLITKQQSALEKLGVPTMFMTDSVTDRDVGVERTLPCLY